MALPPSQAYMRRQSDWFRSSGLNGRGSPSPAVNGVQPSISQQAQRPVNGQPLPLGANGVQPPPPSQQQGQPGQQQGSSQSRPAYPWSQRRLQLPPPVTIPKPGVAPPTSPSPSPFPRYGHALPTNATTSGELFLFGGLVRETVRNDLYLLSVRDLSATLLQTSGEIPSPRVGHASALVGSVLIVWGGDTKTGNKAKSADKQDDGLYLLNLGASQPISGLQTLSDTNSSIPRVDSRSRIRPFACWSVWACGNDGRIEVLRVRWTGRRRVLERPLVFRSQLL